MKKIKAAVIGGSGYTGAELARILSLHPSAELVAVTSRANCGREVSELYPHLRGICGLAFEEADPAALGKRVDVVFTAVPHAAAMAVVPDLLAAGCRVVDLSADFRIRSRAVYEEWYVPHTAPELLSDAVYGLPERYRRQIATARLVANPGCYPTSIILAAAPLLAAGVIEPDTLIADSKSGTSGAGRGANVATLFCEVTDGFRAYKVASHRHTPEIEQELGAACGREINISFTPHLVPMSRGILSTVYAGLAADIDPAGVREIYGNAYGDEPFVRLCPDGALPATQYVRGSNLCDIAFRIDRRTGRLILVSAIDNLVKGAAGQAVQNMNVMFGLEETCGLLTRPLFP